MLWDGWTESGTPTDPNAHFCLGSKSPWPSFRMFDGMQFVSGSTMQSTDPTSYECDLTRIPGSPP